jgi:hypothetical protein
MIFQSGFAYFRPSTTVIRKTKVLEHKILRDFDLCGRRKGAQQAVLISATPRRRCKAVTTRISVPPSPTASPKTTCSQHEETSVAQRHYDHSRQLGLRNSRGARSCTYGEAEVSQLRTMVAHADHLRLNHSQASTTSVHLAHSSIPSSYFFTVHAPTCPDVLVGSSGGLYSSLQKSTEHRSIRQTTPFTPRSTWPVYPTAPTAYDR